MNNPLTQAATNNEERETGETKKKGYLPANTT
jgi:hypothetical protein